jgi:ATP-dependent Clp protease ATP-binding subunit ClpC
VFERFSEGAREVIVLAQDEARALRHNYLGTEHLLLGLMRQEDGLAARLLESRGATLQRVRQAVLHIVGAGDEVVAGQVPFTPRAKDALELSMRSAVTSGHNHIGTEQLLLGLLREGEGVAAAVLTTLGIDVEALRRDLTMTGMAGSGRPQPDKADVPLPFSEELRDILRRAEELAREGNAREVAPSHIRQALGDESEDAS